MELRQWAAREGVHCQTAWRWRRDGKLPVPARQTATGTILVEVPAAGGVADGVVVVYARVSSHDQRADPDPGETADDLVREMIEVLASVCARLYGRRGARNRALRAVTAAKTAGVDAAA
jgi:putative resolvase